MIRPTIYIGVGSSGYAILQGVRRHLFEEYGMPSLPCMRFIVLETAPLPQDPLIADNRQPWQSIEHIPIGISINQLQSLKGKIDRGSPHYHPGWEEWLDPDLFNSAGFTAGASGWRMAGRLCLWSNWDTVYTTIQRAVGTSTGGITETRKFLQSLPGKAVSLGERPLRIYVCGSLCGGTGSGIFVEIGYMAQEAMRSANITQDPDIHGYFSTVDKQYIDTPAVGVHSAAVNAWSAMLEYDYWASGVEPFQIDHPENSMIKFPMQPNDAGPYTWMHLVCPHTFYYSGTQNLVEFHATLGTALYLDNVDNYEQRRQDSGFGNYKGPICQWSAPSRSSLYRENLISFGISGFYYPKYIIALAAAYEMSAKVVYNWLSPVNQENVKRFAVEDADEVIKQIQQRISLGGQKPTALIRQLIENQLTAPKSIDDLIGGYLQIQVPIVGKNLLLHQALDLSGGIHTEMSAPINEIADKMMGLIEKMVRDRLNSIPQGRCSSVQEVSEYLEGLIVRIQQHAELLSQATVDVFPSARQILDPIIQRFAEISTDGWLKGLGLRGGIQRYYIVTARAGLLEKVETRVALLINCVVRDVCQQIILKYNRSSGIAQRSNIKAAIQEKIQAIQSIRVSFDEKKKKLTDMPQKGHLHLLTLSDSNLIGDDIRKIVTDITQDYLQTSNQTNALNQKLIQTASFDEFTVSPEKIETGLIAQFLPIALQMINNAGTAQTKIDLMAKVRALPMEQLLNSARKSDPFLQISGGYNARMRMGRFEPDMIVGPNGSMPFLEHLIANLKGMDNNLPTFKPVDIAQDNMIIFYNEAAGLSLEDWQLADVLDKLLFNKLKSVQGGKQSGIYTHQHGHFRYHPVVRKMHGKLLFWSTICDWFASPLVAQEFLVRHNDGTRDAVYYVYRSRIGGAQYVDLKNEDILKNFAFADNGQHAEKFISDLKQNLISLEPQGIRTRIDELQHSEPDPIHKNDIGLKGDELMKELFPESINPAGPKLQTTS